MSDCDRDDGCRVRRDHPQVGRRITRELFNQLPHIDVHVALGRPGTGHRVAQRGWERAGVRRRVVLTVPYFMTVALAAATDCIAGLTPFYTSRVLTCRS